jgi:photosystem II stability/assembly factor-like uncharacterized protein
LDERWIHSIALKGDTVFAGTISGVYYSSDIGNTWKITNDNFDEYIWSLVIVNNAIIAGTDNGIFFSFDNGINWKKKNEGLTELRIRSIVLLKNKLFIGTLGKGIFTSTDFGDTWISKRNGLTCDTVLSLAISGNDIYAATYLGGISYSSDLGETWHSKYNGFQYLDQWNMEIEACDNILVVARGQRGIFFSIDYGNNWNESNNGIDYYNFVWEVEIINKNYFAGTSWGLYSTDNLLKRWYDVSGGWFSDVRAINHNNDYIFVGSWGDGFFRRKLSSLLSDVDEMSSSNLDLSIFPNPASDFIEISVGANGRSPLQSDVKIYNVLGEIQTTPSLRDTPPWKGGEKVRIDVSGLAPGMYFVRVGDIVGKLIKL